MTSESERPPEITPLVDWFSRHGIKVLAALLLVELGFHAYAVTSAKKRDAAAAAAASAAAPAAATSLAPAASDSLTDSTSSSTSDSVGTR